MITVFCALHPRESIFFPLETPKICYPNPLVNFWHLSKNISLNQPLSMPIDAQILFLDQARNHKYYHQIISIISFSRVEYIRESKHHNYLEEIILVNNPSLYSLVTWLFRANQWGLSGLRLRVRLRVGFQKQKPYEKEPTRRIPIRFRPPTLD